MLITQTKPNYLGSIATKPFNWLYLIPCHHHHLFFSFILFLISFSSHPVPELVTCWVSTKKVHNWRHVTKSQGPFSLLFTKPNRLENLLQYQLWIPHVQLSLLFSFYQTTQFLEDRYFIMSQCFLIAKLCYLLWQRFKNTLLFDFGALPKPPRKKNFGCSSCSLQILTFLWNYTLSHYPACQALPLSGVLWPLPAGWYGRACFGGRVRFFGGRVIFMASASTSEPSPNCSLLWWSTFIYSCPRGTFFCTWDMFFCCRISQ